MTPQQLIKTNAKGNDNTFIYALHEQRIFNLTLFDELIKAICLCTILSPVKKLTLNEDVFQLFEFISCCFYSHLLDDLYRIENFYPDNAREQSEKLRLVTHKYFINRHEE